ncbi:hypothetical protein Trydic_g7969 [Trypoxylus dichotomus]
MFADAYPCHHSFFLIQVYSSRHPLWGRLRFSSAAEEESSKKERKKIHTYSAPVRSGDHTLPLYPARRPSRSIALKLSGQMINVMCCSKTPKGGNKRKHPKK